ncbi:MAG TPA: response regulator transcription factor [Longimicrobiaceae bacterium]|nr:response regulator transcription factor [Longimicrobiaceae bacterium]
MSRILVVEDNANLAYGLSTSLELEGHQVAVARDGAEGLCAARQHPPDLVILDLMLPEMDGYRVLKALREDGCEVPVLILTARGAESDKVLGFRLGADDYVTKPFGLLELLARVGALLRRAARPVPDAGEVAVVTLGEIEVSPAQRAVRLRGEEVPLTPKEFDLLMALVRRKGTVAGRLELLAEVWGHRAAVMTRTVDMHVAQLRRKLEDDPADPRHILTVWKAGYRIAT